MVIPLSAMSGYTTPGYTILRYSTESNPVGSEPAQVKKSAKENVLVYTFQALSIPEQNLYEATLSRFQRIQGFVSLKLNENNQVELTTKPDISQEDNTRLLSVTTKMYGYPVFNVIE